MPTARELARPEGRPQLRKKRSSTPTVFVRLLGCCPSADWDVSPPDSPPPTRLRESSESGGSDTERERSDTERDSSYTTPPRSGSLGGTVPEARGTASLLKPGGRRASDASSTSSDNGIRPLDIGDGEDTLPIEVDIGLIAEASPSPQNGHNRASFELPPSVGAPAATEPPAAGHRRVSSEPPRVTHRVSSDDSAASVELPSVSEERGSSISEYDELSVRSVHVTLDPSDVAADGSPRLRPPERLSDDPASSPLPTAASPSPSLDPSTPARPPAASTQPSPLPPAPLPPPVMTTPPPSHARSHSNGGPAPPSGAGGALLDDDDPSSPKQQLEGGSFSQAIRRSLSRQNSRERKRSAAPAADEPASPSRQSLVDSLRKSITRQSSRELSAARAAAAAAAVLVHGGVAAPLTDVELARLPNKNRVHDFEWLSQLLTSVVENRADRTEDVASRVAGTPLFVVAGACPNPFCGMQAVMYVRMHGAAQRLDFWWVKPEARNPRALEAQTLRRHAKGAHKNDPGRSREVYAKFADLFDVDDGGVTTRARSNSHTALSSARSNKAGGGKLGFDVGEVDGKERAYIEQLATGERYWLYLIWQEDWTTNPFARSKYVKGQIVYQKDPNTAAYYARPFAYRDGVLSVPADARLEEAVPTVLPPDRIKLNLVDL